MWLVDPAKLQDEIEQKNLRALYHPVDRYSRPANPTQPGNDGNCAWQHVPENENE